MTRTFSMWFAIIEHAVTSTTSRGGVQTSLAWEA